MSASGRKIIHVDMDCFYAAIEMRDQPKWQHQPIAVGGQPHQRGVICTSNYVARQFGVRSAMASAYALQLCPNLKILPVDMAKYRQVSAKIREIFFAYSDLVEPLSLDEAYIDVTACPQYQGSATRIAKAIRAKIWQSQRLRASAGVAPNKFLAKIASDWQKPNGLFVITPEQVEVFVAVLPVKKIFGVGKVSAKRLAAMGIQTCQQLQQLSLLECVEHFGKFGARLYELSRGMDTRPVEPNRLRKSVSVETTFTHDLIDQSACVSAIADLFIKLEARLKAHSHRQIHKQIVKIKYADFSQTSIETLSHKLVLEIFVELFKQRYALKPKPIRLLGVGVGFVDKTLAATQLSLDF